MYTFVEARVVFFLGYIAVLLWFGFRRRMGFASWHMFAGINRCWFELREVGPGGGFGRRFNPWVHLPHSHLAMSRRELDFFLCYLKEIRGLKLNGTVTVREGLVKEKLKVRNSHVVV